MTLCPKALQPFIVVESLKKIVFLAHCLSQDYNVSQLMHELDFKIPHPPPRYSHSHFLGSILPPTEILRLFSSAFPTYLYIKGEPEFIRN